jgi:Ser/Thr protein kinase RdoA (MazF antagonist)
MRDYIDVSEVAMVGASPRTPSAFDVQAMAAFLEAYCRLSAAGAKDADEAVVAEMGRVMRLWCGQFGTSTEGE